MALCRSDEQDEGLSGLRRQNKSCGKSGIKCFGWLFVARKYHTEEVLMEKSQN